MGDSNDGNDSECRSMPGDKGSLSYKKKKEFNLENMPPLKYNWIMG